MQVLESEDHNENNASHISLVDANPLLWLRFDVFAGLYGGESAIVEQVARFPVALLNTDVSECRQYRELHGRA